MPSTSETCSAYYGAIKHLLNCITLVSFTTIYMVHGTMKTKNSDILDIIQKYAVLKTDYGLERSGYRIPMGRDFPPIQTGPGAHPASCTMGTGSLPGVKYGRGVLLTTHPLLVPRSWKSRAIPLPSLWATTGPVTVTLYLYL